MPKFDATITLSDHHVAMSGLTGPAASTVVREAVKRIAGAVSIDVEAQSYPPQLPWVVLYKPGRSVLPDTPVWKELQQQVEAVATAALVGAGKSV